MYIILSKRQVSLSFVWEIVFVEAGMYITFEFYDLLPVLVFLFFCGVVMYVTATLNEYNLYRKTGKSQCCV